MTPDLYIAIDTSKQSKEAPKNWLSKTKAFEKPVPSSDLDQESRDSRSRKLFCFPLLNPAYVSWDSRKRRYANRLREGFHPRPEP